MSDPVSNAEIEDVLSSIRQLISESKSTGRRGTPDRPEKLILTAAFRVHDDEPSQAAQPDQSEEFAAKPHTTSEQKLSAPAQTTASKDIEPEDDPLPVFSHRGYRAGSADDAGASSDEETVSNNARQHHPNNTSATKHSLERSSDQWEPDGGEDTEQAAVLNFHAARMHPDQDNIVGENKAQAWGAENEAEAPFIEVDTLTPKGDQSSDNSDPPALVASSNVEIVEEDTHLIDEEIVQAMVARLVREELQGEVGEKITQSIRRFVRQEIARAITLKELR